MFLYSKLRDLFISLSDRGLLLYNSITFGTTHYSPFPVLVGSSEVGN